MTTKIKTYAIPAAAALMLWNAGRHLHAILNYYSTNGTITLEDGTIIRPKLRVARDIFEWVVAGHASIPVVVSEGSYQVVRSLDREPEGRFATMRQFVKALDELLESVADHAEG